MYSLLSRAFRIVLMGARTMKCANGRFVLGEPCFFVEFVR